MREHYFKLPVPLTGTPSTLDVATQNRVLRHFVQILVDVSKNIFDENMVEREWYAFYVDVTYEWILDFCFHDGMIGHYVTNCQ